MSNPIWLTDRSRYSVGTGRCRMQRYLTNHFGPTGYGIVRKAESLPLATGKYTHLALEHLFVHLRDTDTFPEVGLIREAIKAACDEYEKRIVARGFRGLLKSETSDQVLIEQQALLSGLVWIACRTVLPWIWQNFRIVEAETESLYVLGCTCGLGPMAPQAEHEARDCQGIGQMLKQDVIAERRHGNGVAYFEGKTTGWSGDNWAPQWETRPQLGLGTLGITERLGKEITEAYVLALYKGARRGKKDLFGEETVQQDSCVCYGYCRPGNPPLATDDWKPTYRWEEDGKTRQVSRQHIRRGIWELPQSDFPEWVASKAAQPDLTPTEFWTAWLPQPIAEQQVFLVGPLNRQDTQVTSLKLGVVAEERDWQRRLWDLYEVTHDGLGWPSAEFQTIIDVLFPRSWECRRFGVRHECEFKMLCFKEQGWEDPIGNGKYVPRRPHHAPELAQAVSRGLLPEQAEEEEGEEE